jgi:hypothetical protein
MSALLGTVSGMLDKSTPRKPGGQARASLIYVMALATALTACGSPPGESTTVGASTGSSPVETLLPAPASASKKESAVNAVECPVTKPGVAPASIGDALFGWQFAAGNDALWIGALGPDGVITVDSRMVSADGSIGWKFGWYRLAPGRLEITGHAFGHPDPVIISDIAAGYGLTGFQPSGVTFPGQGCWEITGTVGTRSLSIVTMVTVV